jgi:hypothetical protein
MQSAMTHAKEALRIDHSSVYLDQIRASIRRVYPL